MKRAAVAACRTCPHAHPDQPAVHAAPDFWRSLVASGETIACHESFPDDWDEREDERELRECRGVLDARAVST